MDKPPSPPFPPPQELVEEYAKLLKEATLLTTQGLPVPPEVTDRLLQLKSELGLTHDSYGD
jgi:hypothetical protein